MCVGGAAGRTNGYWIEEDSEVRRAEHQLDAASVNHAAEEPTETKARNPPSNQCGLKKNGALTREVFRNQEKHCRASLSWPFPTLLDFLHELHHFLTHFV